MVDDDPYSHMICRKMIQRTIGEIEFIEFTFPAKAVEYIESAYNTGECATILLLDINMPVMSGWEFLEWFETVDQHVKDQFTIYLLSSSVDPRDKEKAMANKNVKGFFMKPFKKVMVEEIFAL